MSDTHRKTTDLFGDSCYVCGQVWPCDASLLRTQLATLTAAAEEARAALWEMQELIGADRSRTPRFLEWMRLDDLATTADFALFAALAPEPPQGDATGTEGRR